MTIKSFYELSDISLPTEEEAIITEIIIKRAQIISFHNLRTRRSGSRRLIDVHIILHKNMHLDIAHNICDQIEAEIEMQLDNCDVVIHIEPYGYHSELGKCPLELKDKEAQQ